MTLKCPKNVVTKWGLWRSRGGHQWQRLLTRKGVTEDERLEHPNTHVVEWCCERCGFAEVRFEKHDWVDVSLEQLPASEPQKRREQFHHKKIVCSRCDAPGLGTAVHEFEVVSTRWATKDECYLFVESLEAPNCNDASPEDAHEVHLNQETCSGCGYSCRTITYFYRWKNTVSNQTVLVRNIRKVLPKYEASRLAPGETT